MKTLLRLLLFVFLFMLILVIGGSGFGTPEVLLAAAMAWAISFGPAFVAGWRKRSQQ